MNPEFAAPLQMASSMGPLEHKYKWHILANHTWKTQHEKSLIPFCSATAISSLLGLLTGGLMRHKGEHTWLPGMHHSLYFSTAIKSSHFKVTFFQLASQHCDPAEYMGVCIDKWFWHGVINWKNINPKTHNGCYIFFQNFFRKRITNVKFS